MPKKAKPPLSEEQIARIQEIPLADLLKARLDPLVQPVYRGRVSHVHDRILDETSRALILIALEKTEGRVGHAAAILGVGRNTLARRAERLGISMGRAAKRSRGRTGDA